MKKIILLFLILVLNCLAKISYAELPIFPKYYFFGDSLTDTGNYKEIKPSPCVRVDAPVTNTTGGNQPGTIWASVTQQGFNATPSNKGGNDWATAGSETDDVVQQVNNYLRQQPQADPNALYIFWAGSNDVIEKIYEHLQSRDHTIQTGMSNLESSINKLYQAGARNFLVIALPDISITPLVSAHLKIKDYKSYIGLFHIFSSSIKKSCLDWNSALLDTSSKDGTTLSKAPLAYLALNDPGIRIYTWNPAPLLDKVVMDPAQFGFPNTVNGAPNNQTAWCTKAVRNGSDPDNYIFFNYMHPSARAHLLLAQQIRENADLFMLT